MSTFQPPGQQTTYTTMVWGFSTQLISFELTGLYVGRSKWHGQARYPGSLVEFSITLEGHGRMYYKAREAP